MPTVAGSLPTLRDNGTTTVEFDTAAALFDARLSTFHQRDLEVVVNYSIVGPASVRFPIAPRQTKFPKTP